MLFITTARIASLAGFQHAHQQLRQRTFSTTGFANNPQRFTLTQSQIAGKLIDQENPERNSLIYAIAEAHGGKEAQPAVRAAQIKRWKDQFHSGWWIEDAQGNWYKKP